MRKAGKFRSQLLALSFLFLFFGSAQAAERGGVATACIVTIEKVLLKGNYGEWVTILQPDKQADIINGESTVSFFNKGKIPPGPYFNFKIIISEIFKVSGHEGKDNHTREGGREVIVSRAKTLADMPAEITEFTEEAPTYSPDVEGLMTVHLDFDNGDKDRTIEITSKRDLSDPLNIRQGSFVSVRFNLNVDESVSYAWPASIGKGQPEKDAMVFMPPNKMENVEITVDRRTEVIPGDQIVMTF